MLGAEGSDGTVSEEDRVRRRGWVTAGGLVSLVVVSFAIAPPQRAATAAGTGWIVSCRFSHSAPDDPIVFPGAGGASHLHDFLGARSTDEHSTAETLRAGGTTCTTAGDASAYWVPALYRRGRHVPPTATTRHVLVYYRRVGAPSGVSVQPFPDGLRVIVGAARATSPGENEALGTGRVSFKCGPGERPERPRPPRRCASGVMVVSYQVPNCWDGVRLDAPDHASHMAYPVDGRCRSPHDVVLPRVQAFFRYPVPADRRIGRIAFASGPYYTAHMDFFNAWETEDLGALVQGCLNRFMDCGRDPVVHADGTITPGQTF
jgi:Domain of unknown function (DUF1996)